MKRAYSTLKVDMILLAFLSFIIAGATGCNKNDDKSNGSEYQNPYRENIIGKWKLVKLITYQDYDWQNSDTVDYSKENIIYNFCENNLLDVTGNVYVQDGLLEGTHIYEYKKPNVCPTCLPGPNLTIDTNNNLFCLAPSLQKEMEMSGNSIGGQIIGENGLIIESGITFNWIKIFIEIK